MQYLLIILSAILIHSSYKIASILVHVEFADREIEFLPTFHAFCLVVCVAVGLFGYTNVCVYLYNTSGLNSLMREWCVLHPLELCNCYNFNFRFLVHGQELSDHLLCVRACVRYHCFLDEYLCCSCALIF